MGTFNYIEHGENLLNSTFFYMAYYGQQQKLILHFIAVKILTFTLFLIWIKLSQKRNRFLSFPSNRATIRRHQLPCCNVKLSATIHHPRKVI